MTKSEIWKELKMLNVELDKSFVNYKKVELEEILDGETTKETIVERVEEVEVVEDKVVEAKKAEEVAVDVNGNVVLTSEQFEKICLKHCLAAPQFHANNNKYIHDYIWKGLPHIIYSKVVSAYYNDIINLDIFITRVIYRKDKMRKKRFRKSILRNNWRGNRKVWYEFIINAYIEETNDKQ